ncbi:hypothetical protein [Mycolicibacterium moriokaense]|nr:hypothetical protein [Mycolicibacterium moriokaense]MCV7040918.1 hypothetical protein [Mycolicibacterium moriokaense]
MNPQPLNDVLEALSRSLELDHGGVTRPQQAQITHAIATVINGRPDASVSLRRDGGLRLHDVYWVRDSMFGCVQVDRPADSSSTVPVSGWVRPLSSIEQIDIETEVVAHPVMGSHIEVKLKITIHWSATPEDPTVLDSTGSISAHVRLDLENLIQAVLAAHI